MESHEVQVQTIGVEVTGKVKSPKKYPLLISNKSKLTRRTLNLN